MSVCRRLHPVHFTDHATHESHHLHPLTPVGARETISTCVVTQSWGENAAPLPRPRYTLSCYAGEQCYQDILCRVMMVSSALRHTAVLFSWLNFWIFFFSITLIDSGGKSSARRYRPVHRPLATRRKRPPARRENGCQEIDTSQVTAFP